LTKGPLFLQDKETIKRTLSQKVPMAHYKNSSKLNELQEILLNDENFLKGIVESFCQRLLEEEMLEHLQADKYQRTDKRRGYRNGYKPRKLKKQEWEP